MPTLQFISGAGSGNSVAQGVNGQISALNTTISNLNAVYTNYYASGNLNTSITFYLNGKLTTVKNVDPTMKLVDYIRYQTPYQGTKQHCRAGGCGVCAVMISYYDTDSQSFRNVSVNSCLRLLVQCDGVAIWTTEGIKISKTQYHPVQERIAKTYGLQCGACTTGQVMAQYTALQPGTFMQKAEYQYLEKNFDGNLCRCSCYPGIIKMARSFLPSGAAGSPQVYDGATLVGWDLNATGPGSASTGADGGFYTNYGSSTSNYTQLNPKGFLLYNSALDVNATSNSTISSFLQNYSKTALSQYTNSNWGVTYYRATSLADAISNIQSAGVATTKLVASNTSVAVPGYEDPFPNTYTLFLDINGVPELHSTRVTSTGAVFGANVPINKVVSLLTTGASTDSKFNKIADHLFYISGNHVRNVASILGGVVMAKRGGFASDVVPLLVAANATLNATYVYPTYTQSTTLTVPQYLSTVENGFKILLTSVVIPAKATGEVFYSYRLAQRHFNSHAWLNIATSYTVTANVISNSIIAFGGLETGAGYSTAPLTASYLNTKDISSASAGSTGAINTIISGALTNVASDIYTKIAPLAAFNSQYGDGKLAFRKNLANTLWYLSFLNLLQTQGYLSNYAAIQNALEKWISGTTDSTRVPDLVYENYTERITSEYPLRDSLPRGDAIAIAAGEARFNDDVPSQPGQLWAVAAGSEIACGSVDWDSATTQNTLAAARATPGIEYVITAQDFYAVSKENATTNLSNYLGFAAANAGNWTGANQVNTSNTELFADQFISYKGHRIALVLSQDFDLARRVADNMRFGYKNQYNGYATSVFDGVAREIALNGSTLNNTGTFMLKNSVRNYATAGANAVNNKAYSRNYLPLPLYPYTGGLAYPTEIDPATIQVGPTGVNTRPRSATTTIFTLPDGITTYESYYYTGPNGQIVPWSDFIIQSTGTFTSDKTAMALERKTVNCYRDEQGVYQMNISTHFINLVFALVGPALGLTRAQINGRVKRLGGGFGEKLFIQMNSLVAGALLACYIADGRMVRYVPPIEEEISKICNGESETWSPYTIGFNATGVLNSVYVNSYSNTVYGINPTWLTNNSTSNPTGYRTVPSSDSMLPYTDASRGFISSLQNLPSSYYTLNVIKVPKVPRSFFRAPYQIHHNLLFGNMIDDIAGYLDRRFTDIAYLNTPQTPWVLGTTNPPTNMDRYEWQNMMNRLETNYNYSSKLAAVQAFNAANKYVKRGIEVYYGKYDGLLGLGGVGNFDPYFKILPGGEVLVYAGAVEIGQGAHAKIRQYMASRLKCPPSLITIKENNVDYTQSGGNAGSGGTISAIKGLEKACDKFFEKYAQFFTGAANGDLIAYNLYSPTPTAVAGIVGPPTPIPTPQNLSAAMTGNNGLGNPAPWKALIGSLSVSFMYVQTGPAVDSVISYPAQTPFSYANAGNANELLFQGTAYPVGIPSYTGAYVHDTFTVMLAAMSTVEVNILTGNVKIFEADIIADVGNSLNPDIDAGQLYGGYIMGLGAAFKEEKTWDNNLNLLIKNTWDYKPPCNVDIPSVFNIEFYGNTGAYTNTNTRIMLDGKGISEIAVLSVNSTFFAAKAAIREFRKQQGLSRNFTLIQPATPDRIQAAAGFDPSMLNVNPL